MIRINSNVFELSADEKPEPVLTLRNLIDPRGAWFHRLGLSFPRQSRQESDVGCILHGWHVEFSD